MLLSQEDFTTIADPLILRIPIAECGDPLFDLRTQDLVVFGPPPERPDNVCYTKVRKNVYDRLCEAQKQLPKGIRFCLYEGWRSLKLQGELFQNLYEKNRVRYPQMNPEQLFKETTKLIAPVQLLDGSSNIPPHSTGAAIDVYLIDDAGNLLDMGLALDQWMEDRGALLSQTNSSLVSNQAQQYRSLMSKVLTLAGFVNYPYEYWHWSYGDRYWAYRTNHPYALYGPIEQNQ